MRPSPASNNAGRERPIAIAHREALSFGIVNAIPRPPAMRVSIATGLTNGLLCALPSVRHASTVLRTVVIGEDGTVFLNVRFISKRFLGRAYAAKVCAIRGTTAVCPT